MNVKYVRFHGTHLSSGGVLKDVRVGTPSRSIPAQPAVCTDSICKQKKEIKIRQVRGEAYKPIIERPYNLETTPNRFGNSPLARPGNWPPHWKSESAPA